MEHPPSRQHARPRSDQPRHLPGLDGLRGVAVALVVGFRAGLPGLRGGGLGVVVFFTLSGFLITLLLTREFDATGRLDLPRFYLRRALRLAPALLALLLLCVAGAAVLLSDPERASLLSEVGGAAAYGTNVHLETLPSFPAGSYLGHTWSLSVEEQFYLLWPVTLLVLLRGRWSRRLAAAAVLAAAVAAAGWRMWLSTAGHTDHAAYGLDTNAVGLLLGAALALALTATPTGPARRGARAATPVFLGSGLLLATVTVVGTGTVLAHGVAELLASLATVGLCWCVAVWPSLRVAAVLQWRPLVALGVISYGVYLWHLPVFAVVTSDRLGWPPEVLLVTKTGVALAAAVVSYRLVERPFLRLKSHLGVRRPTPPGAPAATWRTTSLGPVETS